MISAFLAGALANKRANSVDPGSISDPLSISVPKELWILTGISLTSLIGSPLILNAKKSQQPKDAEVERTLEILNRQGEDVEEIDNVGRVVIKEYPARANIPDLFEGDEVSNAAQLYLGKVQVFYFTLILVFACGVQLGSLFLNSSGVVENLPVLSTGMLAARNKPCRIFDQQGRYTLRAAPGFGAAGAVHRVSLASVASTHGFLSYRLAS